MANTGDGYQKVGRLASLIPDPGNSSDIMSRKAAVQNTVSIMTARRSYLTVNIGYHLDRI